MPGLPLRPTLAPTRTLVARLDLGGAAAGAGGIVNGATDKIAGAGQTAIDGAGGVAQTAAGGAQGAGETVFNGAKGVASTVKDGATGAVGDLSQAKSALDGFKQLQAWLNDNYKTILTVLFVFLAIILGCILYTFWRCCRHCYGCCVDNHDEELYDRKHHKRVKRVRPPRKHLGWGLKLDKTYLARGLGKRHIREGETWGWFGRDDNWFYDLSKRQLRLPTWLGGMRYDDKYSEMDRAYKAEKEAMKLRKAQELQERLKREKEEKAEVGKERQQELESQMR